MTEKQKQDYLAINGVRCPYCQSVDLTTGACDTQDDCIYRNVVCETCKKEWTDEFTLSGLSVSVPIVE